MIWYPTWRSYSKPTGSRFQTRCPGAAQLVEELQKFKIKITLAGNDTYEAWRESDHDDLVIATAMACWYGERKLRSIMHLPPMPQPPIETRQPTLDELIELQPKDDPDGRSRI